MSLDDPNREERVRFDDPTFSYLKRHYFDADKLATRTMDEFIRAVRSGRLIAFSGSMTTTDRHYLEWGKFAEKCFEFAENAVENNRSAAANVDIINKCASVLKTFEEKIVQDKYFDKRVAFSIIGEVMDVLSRYLDTGHIDNLNKDIAGLFLTRTASLKGDTVLGNLFKYLNIDRLVTLNYDFEAELEIASAGPDACVARDRLAQVAVPTDDPATGKIVLRLPGGRSLASDVFERERTDRLIEFAVGSAEHDFHVMHLHGRADRYSSMVVSYRDYDRLYRRSGISKTPFEYALNLLYSGNPILFLGLGMSEAEVNQALQDVVGNHPYRRIMPTFLLWNAPDVKDPVEREKAKEILRIDRLHRLGVLTLFDDDLAAFPRRQGCDVPAPDFAATPEARLAQALRNLARALAVSERKRLCPLKHWRSMDERARPGELDAGVLSTWAVDPPAKAARHAAPPALHEQVASSSAMLTLVTGTSGLRKGAAARQLAEDLKAADRGDTIVHINTDFCFDTDTVLNLIAEVLWRQKRRKGARDLSRTRQFSDRNAFRLPNGERLVVVIGGAERLFGHGGEPLSAEFDEMMRFFVDSCRRHAGALDRHVRFIIIGTQRVESYFQGMIVNARWYADFEQKQQATHGSRLFDRIDYAALYAPGPGVRSRHFYLDHVLTRPTSTGRPEATIADLRVQQKSGPNVTIADYRRASYATMLAPANLAQAGLDPGLTLDILTIMAFIGQPVEAEVLVHAPRLRKRLDLQDCGQRLDAIRQQLGKMLDIGLVLQIQAHPSSGHMPRFGMHGTLLAELRDRSGVPLSEAVLSTAFNMSLYAAQPADGPLPEPFLHNELGQLIDWLIGAYKDGAPSAECVRPEGRHRIRPDAIAALRAALAVVRGFYSTSALLSIENDKASPMTSERDGALTEHGERLERMITAFLKSQHLIMQVGGSGTVGAFYADEIVWLHNERGVVKLVQGDLYEARAAFEDADRINREHVEFDDHAHNWRRITLNQILVDIERGRIASARERIDTIERGIDAVKLQRILMLARRPGHGAIGTDPIVSHEEILAIGLTSGYRGLCAHIVGDIPDAQKYFERALAILHHLGEARAYAIFQRHYASLGPDALGRAQADAVLDLAIATAEAAHQMDVVHQGRLRRADRRIASGELGRLAECNRDLSEALTYADVTDMYRVRVEARRGLAHARKASGDYEVALEHAMDAMATATRYGMSLRKIDLRILIGEILIHRGDPRTGKALIDVAIEEAGRVGYQQAMAMARQIVVA